MRLGDAALRQTSPGGTIVWQLAQVHDGHINVENEPGRGMMFPL
ncbi:MAG: hypothetical protein U9Q70_09730 [Chloroflexota bacterium]|nr:hypothetical protein [Chloroflexota bacterium]